MDCRWNDDRMTHETAVTVCKLKVRPADGAIVPLSNNARFYKDTGQYRQRTDIFSDTGQIQSST